MSGGPTHAAIRPARLSDVAAIVDAARDFGREGIMIPLSVGDVTERLREFLVAETPGRGVIGCIAVHVTWGLLVEVRSLAVRRTDQGKAVGRMLMEAAMDDARRLGASEVFTLTYIPDFFRRFGFEEVDRGELPHKVWLDCVK
ncbi:MAG: GNAT family N-acetyltransferase, partial [Planctomycetota bacterium]|nr:GNAT family N-acetyltransferase [Planctomycetota bacterium]